MKVKKILLPLILVSIFSIFLVFYSFPAISNVISQPAQEITSVYTMYNGTYFPYRLIVKYFPANYSSGMGFPSTWSVTNYNQGHNAVVKTDNNYLLQGVNWELPVNNVVGGVSIPLTTPPSQLPWAQQM
ncbi:pyrrolo-quinoline quinone, partial [Acidianus sp. DSM 29099]|nr:pyrrolo-quinoline quinone [Acidianus sp. RZ1]